MGFGEAVKSCLSKYFTFSGRAPRSEYWWFTLAMVIGSIIAAMLDAVLMGANDGGLFSVVFSLAVCIPAISVTVRRLHDIGRTGWWWWIYLVPVIGVVVILVFACLKSQPGANRFGPNPLTGDADIADVFA